VQRNFSRIADVVTDWTGSPWASILAVVIVAGWGLGLVHYGFQDQNYQLVINTGTTIVTFIMVFLIQHSTNRGSRALQLKLDALIAAQDRAENKLIGAEELSEVEIKELQIEHREQVRQAPEMGAESRLGLSGGE
jgi:low affinity Fe/Cu permease